MPTTTTTTVAPVTTTALGPWLPATPVYAVAMNMTECDTYTTEAMCRTTTALLALDTMCRRGFLTTDEDYTERAVVPFGVVSSLVDDGYVCVCGQCNEWIFCSVNDTPGTDACSTLCTAYAPCEACDGTNYTECD